MTGGTLAMLNAVDAPWPEWDEDRRLEEYFRKVEGEDQTLLWSELAKRGQTPPEPDSLKDEEVRGAAESLLTDLAWLGVFFDSTEHLSDRELYAEVFRIVKEEPTACFPDDPYSATTFDFSGSCGDDFDRYFRYYASEEDRAHIAMTSPDFAMPPAELPPYPRDWVPVRQIPLFDE